MIIVFILLGLGFLCGGAAAIVDGLPYMVLERGFTQVIIGTVVSAAGVLMLALAWVLVEIRRLKKTLSNAAMAMSVASGFASPASERDPALPQPGASAVDAAATVPSQAPAAGIGALAGAGAVLAATQALGTPARDEPSHEEPAEPGPLGGEATQSTAEQAGLRGDEAPVVPAGTGEPEGAGERQGTGEPDVDAIPAFDPFRPIDPQGVPDLEARTGTFDAGDEPPRFAAALADANALVDSERDAAGAPAEASVEASADDAPALPIGPGPTDIDDPFEPDLMAANAREADTAREADEFGQLRASLTALQRDVKPADGRIEPSFSGSDEGRAFSTEGIGHRLDDLAAAENWMDPTLQRRAPWFADTAETQQRDVQQEEAPREDAAQPGTVPETRMSETAQFEPAWPEPAFPEQAWPVPVPEPETLPWPPQAREAAAFETEPAASAQEHAAEPADSNETQPFAPAPAAPDAGAQPESPDASDEGIVGAYQVGEAHFTIYADGSIQARTPDGDYSFASMDELKIYLASEKSRLGV
ncbi:hypothetical protein [Bosea vaviloviae]|uniref:Uncharacterized protein n=1 Tax=Bosea vaviloviae TaxID=1526658 RepID=A0A0N1N514_9HYPH|nr:hypothetical protein [Bosea vaviloviae]KPH82513.1 hypothetical protein AE618_03255 [Bosea vaviloviae]